MDLLENEDLMGKMESRYEKSPNSCFAVRFVVVFVLFLFACFWK